MGLISPEGSHNVEYSVQKSLEIARIYSWSRENVLQVGQVSSCELFLKFHFYLKLQILFFFLCTCRTFGMIFFQGISNVEQNASSVEITTVYLKANSVMA